MPPTIRVCAVSEEPSTSLQGAGRGGVRCGVLASQRIECGRDQDAFGVWGIRKAKKGPLVRRGHLPSTGQAPRALGSAPAPQLVPDPQWTQRTGLGFPAKAENGGVSGHARGALHSKHVVC